MSTEGAASLPYRLVIHRLADGSSHGDLFIREPSAQSLRTYELGPDELRALWARRPPPPRVSAVGGGDLRVHTQAHPEAVAAKEKSVHRLRYWEHRGPIDAGRGRIRELARGDVLRFRALPVLFLAWA